MSKSDYISFNLNEEIYVKLTPCGKTRVMEKMPHFSFNTDSDGYTMMQAWEFMEMFGAVTGQMFNNKYYDLTIRIKRK